MKFTSEVFLGGKTATGIPIPAEVVASFGSGKRFPVQVTINGHTYRTTVTVYGGGFMIPLAAEHREAAGIAAGERIEVEMVLDAAPREVELPEDFANALQSAPASQAFFETLSFTYRKEYVRWIEESKKPETRAARVEKSVALLAEGKARR